MKLLLLLTTFLLTLVPISAQAVCPPGDPNKLNYMRRDNNRCEGMRDRRDASGSISLISFVTSNLSNLSNLPDPLTIRVGGSSSPILEVQEFSRNYRLDDVQMNRRGSSAIFLLDTRVLRDADIKVNSLLAAAHVRRNASRTYYPTILGKASGSYTFVLYAPGPTTFRKIQIRKAGKSTLYLNQSLSQPLEGQIPLRWSYGNAPAGSYELYVEDNRGKRSFQFEHNPKWL